MKSFRMGETKEQFDRSIGLVENKKEKRENEKKKIKRKKKPDQWRIRIKKDEAFRKHLWKTSIDPHRFNEAEYQIRINDNFESTRYRMLSNGRSNTHWDP